MSTERMMLMHDFSGAKLTNNHASPINLVCITQLCVLKFKIQALKISQKCFQATMVLHTPAAMASTALDLFKFVNQFPSLLPVF